MLYNRLMPEACHITAWVPGGDLSTAFKEAHKELNGYLAAVGDVEQLVAFIISSTGLAWLVDKCRARRLARESGGVHSAKLRAKRADLASQKAVQASLGNCMTKEENAHYALQFPIITQVEAALLNLLEVLGSDLLPDRSSLVLDNSRLTSTRCGMFDRLDNRLALIIADQLGGLTKFVSTSDIVDYISYYHRVAMGRLYRRMGKMTYCAGKWLEESPKPQSHERQYLRKATPGLSYRRNRSLLNEQIRLVLEILAFLVGEGGLDKAYTPYELRH